MTPDEVREVGTTMCATGTGTAMLLYSGAIEHADDPAAMAAAVADVQEACASPTPTR